MIEDVLDEEVELIKDNETIEKISQKIFPILQTKDETNIISEFYNKENKNVDLTLCVNSSHNNNTILTTLVNYNLTRAANNFISIIKSFKKPSDEFLSYINKKNNKGYNALLYSAFRGNLEIFNKLMENGADISTTNSSGLNPLHLAAQGNFPNIIIILIEKYNFDINSRDNKGNTALHWAVYSNSRQAVDYLIYYKIDINLKDNDDDTALRIAMKKNNTYLVKRLRDDFSILHDIKEKETKNENENETNTNQSNSIIYVFIKKLLDKNKTSSSLIPIILILFVLEGFNQIIILLGYNNYFMSMVFFILFFMLLFFYFASSQSDPGEISNKCINSLLILAEQGEDMKNICPWCINYISEKTKHCFLCNKCIKFQEFHDNYINNCIGRNNFSLYMSFLYFLIINLGFKFIISIWGLFWLKGSKFRGAVGFILIQILLTGACAVLCIMKIKGNIQLYNRFYYGNFFVKEIKENTNNNEINTVTINNSSSVKSNANQLPSFEESGRYA